MQGYGRHDAARPVSRRARRGQHRQGPVRTGSARTLCDYTSEDGHAGIRESGRRTLRLRLSQRNVRLGDYLTPITPESIASGPKAMAEQLSGSMMSRLAAELSPVQ